MTSTGTCEIFLFQATQIPVRPTPGREQRSSVCDRVRRGDCSRHDVRKRREDTNSSPSAASMPPVDPPPRPHWRTARHSIASSGILAVAHAGIWASQEGALWNGEMDPMSRSCSPNPEICRDNSRQSNAIDVPGPCEPGCIQFTRTIKLRETFRQSHRIC